MTVQPEEQQSRVEELGTLKIRVTSYRLADEYVCKVDNVDPGAIIARARADRREEAERRAIELAKQAVGLAT